MRILRIFQVVAMILLISTLGVKSAHASEQSLELMLDSGFVGRPVSLDLFDGAVRIGWNANALIQPTKLVVSRSSDGILNVIMDDVHTFASGSLMHVALRSEVQDHPALRVSQNGADISFFANIEKGLLASDIPVAGSSNITAVSDSTVQPVLPSDGTVPLTLTDKQVVFTLDAGFVNRPVSLDVFDGDVTVAWDAKTLIKPTTLTIVSTKGGVWQEQAMSANGVKLLFADPTAVSSAGTFSIKHRALRPPTVNERPDVNIFEVVTSTRKANFSGTSIQYTAPVRSEIVFAPVYCAGIMRTGTATWYKYKGCLCAASPDVPKGTKLKVSRQDDPATSVIVTVNDYGPDRKLFPERVIDLDKVAFAKIGNPRGGILSVTVERVE